ncbi:vinorine synthase-like [Durio zibethinus]|uniref:Vinorine synthase-like n=1 Tax=Durio zibethinus TaxID=66656 RepID=A0A6P5WWV8_DURZI|nr:vinorine synthase-like [Durio zibethinus]
MEVQIMSRETIKPSSPTPEHLRTYKLGLFDQLASPIYVPITLFYSARDGNPGMNSDHLKKSLSKSLTQFYPLAGRIKDDHLTIDCNDDGATFIEAQVACDLSFVLEDPEIEVLQLLLPCNPLEHLPHQSQSITDQVILAAQVNYFACGGMAIGVCISHVIADTSAAAHFLKAWAAVAFGADNIEGVIYDCSSHFPPQDLSFYYRVMSLLEEYNNVESSEDEVVTKRLLFDGSKIADLRNEMGSDGLNLFRPTRVEAVTALIWEALITATAENDRTSQILEASIAVNMRKRMNPPLPEQCIGSICFVTNARSHNEKIENRSRLSRKIHESINEIDDEYIRKIYTSGECFNKFMEKSYEEYEKNPKIGVFYFTSWCRFPFYETDFGFGKPIWVVGGLRVNRIACFLDTSDGEGIEAWISLTKEEMAKLEQQPGILAYATF